jgi:AcrR family transcriptional regulator
MDSTIVQAAMSEAAATGTPVANLSLDRIARRAGLSRSTVYRRVGARRALDDAVREAGGDPGIRVGVRERAITAATELIVADGVAALTVEAVTRRVGCAATSVYAAFGDREGLLAAVFERHAPLPVVERMLATDPQRFADFESDLPLSLLIPLLIAPISVHILARRPLTAAGEPVPDRHAVIEAMTAAFTNAATSTSHRTTSTS